MKQLQMFFGNSRVMLFNTAGGSTPSEPTAPNGKVLYKTSADGEWLQSDANITNGTFDGFSEISSAVAVILPSKDASGNDVTSIGDSAFANYCRDLTSVTIPNTVTSIGDYTFLGCSSLASMTIPNSVMSIGENTFGGCKSLTSVTIGTGVTSIGDAMFYECDALTSVTFLGKTIEEVQNIEDGEGTKQYPWGIEDTSIITVA